MLYATSLRFFSSSDLAASGLNCLHCHGLEKLTLIFSTAFQDHNPQRLFRPRSSLPSTTRTPLAVTLTSTSQNPTATTSSFEKPPESAFWLPSQGSHSDQTNFESEGSTRCDTTVLLCYDAFFPSFFSTSRPEISKSQSSHLPPPPPCAPNSKAASSLTESFSTL